MEKEEQKNWEHLQSHKLKNSVRAAILGFGMAGSTEYLGFKERYYDHASQALQSRINTILIELMEESDPRKVTVGGRAIHICAEIQTSGMLEKIRDVGKSINRLLDFIESAVDLDSCGGLFEYIAEFNNAAGKLRLREARSVLLRQVTRYTAENPKPLSKEYYLHYLCSQSASSALNRIDAA